VRIVGKTTIIRIFAWGAGRVRPCWLETLAFAGVEFRRGVNPLKDRLKLDNCVTRAMQVVMKLVRVASNRHLRNWEAPDALVQEIIPVAS